MSVTQKEGENGVKRNFPYFFLKCLCRTFTYDPIICEHLGYSDISTEVFNSTFESANKQLRIDAEPNRPN